MKLGAIVLAAGGSRRMGKPKQLLLLKEKPIISYVVDVLLSQNFEAILCVTGAYSEQLAALISPPVAVVYNENWQQGLGESIRVGVEAMVKKANCEAIFVCLADQPFLSPTDVSAMIAQHEDFPEKCIASNYAGNPGVPAIFPKKRFDDLLQLSGDKGAKDLLKKLGNEVLLYTHQSSLIDIDTPEDFERAKQL